MRITCPGCLCVYTLDDKDHDGHLSSVHPPHCEFCDCELSQWFEVVILYQDPDAFGGVGSTMHMNFQMTGTNTIDDLKAKIRNTVGLAQQYDLVLFLDKVLLQPHRNWGQRQLCDFGFTLGCVVEAFPYDGDFVQLHTVPSPIQMADDEEDLEWAARMAEMWDQLWEA